MVDELYFLVYCLTVDRVRFVWSEVWRIVMTSRDNNITANAGHNIQMSFLTLICLHLQHL